MKALVAIAIVTTSVPVVAWAAGETSEAVNQERRICRTIRGGGSSTRIERRLCLTRAQWNARHDTSADDEMSDVDVRTKTVPYYADGFRHKGERPK
jgi:hypothetical protein